MKLINFKQYSLLTLLRSVIIGGCAFLTPDWNMHLLAADTQEPLNDTQTNMSDTILSNCLDGPESGGGLNAGDFQTQCNTLLIDASASEQDRAYRQLSPEQTISYGTNANKTSSNQTNSANQTVMNRMSFLRSGTMTVQADGIQFYNNGQPIGQNSFVGLGSINTGAASADEFSKLGLWVNGIFRFGNVDSTFQESKGYNYNNLGVTIGLDYAITQDFILGGAFTYLSTSGDYVNNGGDLQADLFNGSIYASYYITDDFYIDGLAFYGGNNYKITRNVNYTVSSTSEIINAKLEGTPGGKQYGFNFSSGYNFKIQRLVIEPYVGVSYLGTDIDAYAENDIGRTKGWATRYDSQNLKSLKTTLGTLFAYNFDVPWGVLIPQVRGEWHHEFEDDGRTITSHFNGAGGSDNYSVLVAGPDRDYFTFGTSVTSTFDYGITAFLAYDMLIGYNNVNSYGFTLGGRMDF